MTVPSRAHALERMAASEQESLDGSNEGSAAASLAALSPSSSAPPGSIARHETPTASSSSTEPPLPAVPDDTESDLAAEAPRRIPRASHRKLKNARAPPKSILKQPAPRPAGFNFRRDWLQPLNSRLAYAAATATSTPSPEALAAAGASASAITPAAGLQNAAAGFWGSALKKLSGVTAAAAGVPPLPPPKRDLAEDAPSGSSSEATAEASEAALASANEKGDVSSGAAPASYEAATHSRSPTLGSATAAAAPHQPPSRGPATASAPAASPYATIKATVAPSALAAPPAPSPLSVGELKRVRFRMATLKVVYPINGPNGPLAPREESLTKKR